MNIYGDLMIFLAQYLNLNSKIKIILTSWQIRKICIRKYLATIINKSIVHEEYENMPVGLQKFVFKLKKVYTTKGLPNHITHLKFYPFFNDEVDDLPPNLIYINFNYNFDQPVNNLPSKLIYLKFGQNYNQPLFIKYLSNLIFLKLGRSYNQSVDDLPDSLKHLTLLNRFVRRVDNLPRLKTLFIHGYFNQKIDNLPETLEKLYLTPDFQQPITKLPKSIKVIKMYDHYKYVIDHPNEIKFIVVNYCEDTIRIIKTNHLNLNTLERH